MLPPSLSADNKLRHPCSLSVFSPAQRVARETTPAGFRQRTGRLAPPKRMRGGCASPPDGGGASIARSSPAPQLGVAATRRRRIS